MTERTSNVAIYWDFENVQASLVEKKSGPGSYSRTKFQLQEALIDVDSVMEYAATFGVVSINRAYCNWQWYGKYREILLRNGLELIQLFPPGASAKNGGDIKLSLDCTEDLLRFPHIDIVVIVGGDSDYLPLAQKVKAMGKTLVGIGVEANTNRHWARSCHEFKFYEALLLDGEPHAVPVVTSAAPGQQPAPMLRAGADAGSSEDLLRRAIRRLAGSTGDGWVLKGSIRPMLKRLDPTFEEERHGVRSFPAFIKKFEHLLEIRAGRNDQEIRLRDEAAVKTPVPQSVSAEVPPPAPVEPVTKPATVEVLTPSGTPAMPPPPEPVPEKVKKPASRRRAVTGKSAAKAVPAVSKTPAKAPADGKSKKPAKPRAPRARKAPEAS